MTAATTPLDPPPRDLGDTVSTTLVVPATHSMVALLGARDEFLRVLERAVPEVDVHVRGNEMAFSGPAVAVSWLDRAVTELLLVLRTGQALSTETVTRVVTMIRDDLDDSARPAEVLTANILSNRGRTIRPKTA